MQAKSAASCLSVVETLPLSPWLSVKALNKTKYHTLMAAFHSQEKKFKSAFLHIDRYLCLTDYL